MTNALLLAAVPPDRASTYRAHFTPPTYQLTVVHTAEAAVEALASSDGAFDVLVLDNAVEHGFDFISRLRKMYPRLLVLLVDEEADFAMPGIADEISTTPFADDDLARRIQRLLSDRHLETLRADAMPPVRDFAKRLRKTSDDRGRQQAMVLACREMGYDYVAYYRLETSEPLQLVLTAQDGDAEAAPHAPVRVSADETSLIAWVGRIGQSRIAGKDDQPNHPFVRKGRYGAVAGIPVGITSRYGVLIACRRTDGSITQSNVLMLELMGAQLAAYALKET
jgi:CheY-like chemotaxis protein